MLQILAHRVEYQRCSPLTQATHTPHCKLIHRVQDRANQEACLNTCAWLLAGACFAVSLAVTFTAPFACTASTFSVRQHGPILTSAVMQGGKGT